MTDEYPDHRFFLVQRLEARAEHDPSRAGFDGYFSLDYMGSSEYEWGAVPKALKSFREYTDLVIRAYDFELEGLTRPVYFVGEAKTLDAKFKDFVFWATHPRHPFNCQERSDFDEVFAGTQRKWSTTNAWWSLADDVAWSLDSEIAKSLLAGLARTEVAPAPKRGLIGFRR
jgi:hypothetical protein